jgi:hypothetical protein
MAVSGQEIGFSIGTEGSYVMGFDNMAVLKYTNLKLGGSLSLLASLSGMVENPRLQAKRILDENRDKGRPHGLPLSRLKSPRAELLQLIEPFGL